MFEYSIIHILQVLIALFLGVAMTQSGFDKIIDWKDINELIPKFYINQKMKKTGIAGILAASLELTKEGKTQISQEKTFDKKCSWRLLAALLHQWPCATLQATQGTGLSPTLMLSRVRQCRRPAP